jgi:hypothetical protein
MRGRKGLITSRRRGDAVAKNKKTTELGYVNRNQQENLGSTGRPGHHNQTVYRMRCRRCGNEYGANGADIFQKKCPPVLRVCVPG